MKIKKIKNVLTYQDDLSRYVLHSFNEHNIRKNRANKYLGYSLFALFLIIVTLFLSYILISDNIDDIFVGPAFKIILTPQDIAQLRP